LVLPALSKSSALGFLLKFSEVGVPGGGIEPGTAVQQSSAPSSSPARYRRLFGEIFKTFR
jgi:hypothetical protein